MVLIPNPYFKNVPGCGDLKLEQVIVDYVYPLLSVLKDDTGSRYLCMCFDTRRAQQWIITPISSSALTALLENKITLAAPFEDPHSSKILVNMNYQTRAETFQVLDACQIPKEDIPEAGEYLDAEPGEWDEYIRTLEDRGCSSKARGYVILIRYRSCPNRTAPVKWSDSPLSHRKVVRYVACAAK